MPIHGPRWLTITTAIVLGCAAILSGVTAWKSTVMAGHAVEHFTLSTQAVNDANTLAQVAERAMTSERQLFIDHSAAVAAGQDELADSILGMMSPNTRDAIAWWGEQPEADRPLSPFVSANPGWEAPGVVLRATASMERADTYLHKAEKELDQAHSLEFIAALLTVSLLAGGLTGTFESTRARMGLLGVSVTVLLGCAIGTAVFW